MGRYSSRDRDRRRVLGRCRRLPTDELIAEAIYRSHDSDSETSQKMAAASVFGFSRAKYYIHYARQLAARSEALEQQINELHNRADAIDPKTDPKGQATARIMAEALPIELEVTWHIYAICLQNAAYFFRNCARYFGVDLIPPDDRYFRDIDVASNSFEHRNKAVSDLNSKDWHTFGRHNSDQDAFLVGYERDSHGRLLIPDPDNPDRVISFGIGPDDFAEFQVLIDRGYKKLRMACQKKIQSRLRSHPEEIPHPRAIGQILRHTRTPVVSDDPPPSE